MRLLFILNPAAGYGRAARRWSSNAQPLIEKFSATIWTTEAPGHAAFLAEQALREGFDAIIAVGGDGTLSEVAHGYLIAPESIRRRAFLGTWPAGSGCDTARDLGIGNEPQQWIRWLQGPNIQRLDAGRATFLGYDGKPVERFFLNMAAMGIAGDVARRGQQRGKPWGGKASYMADSVIAISSAKARLLEISIDGVAETPKRYHLLFLANTRFTGGGMLIAPTADSRDGKLDVIRVEDISPWKLLWRFPSIYKGRHIGKPGVLHGLARRVDVRSEDTVHLNIDGESAGVLPATFETLPKAVPFLCPIL